MLRHVALSLILGTRALSWISNKISYIHFDCDLLGYTIPTFIEGWKKKFSLEDIYETLPEHNADSLGKSAMQLWSKEIVSAKKHNRRPSLLRILVKFFGWQIFFLCVIIAVKEIIIQMSIAVILGNMISTYTTSTMNTYAIFLIIFSFLSMLLHHGNALETLNVELKMQVLCSTLIYQKILKLNRSTLIQSTPGQIINLLSNDVNKFDKFVYYLISLMISPLQTAAILYLAYNEIGLPAFFGMCCTLLFLPMHFFCGRLIAKYYLKTSVKRDERLRLINEIIHGIEIIKMYAWEKPFGKLISQYRKQEIDGVKSTTYSKGSQHFHTIFISTSIFVTVVTSTLFDISLSAKSMFMVTVLFNSFCSTFMMYVPTGIAAAQQLKVSINRITTFLLSNELELNCLEQSEKNAVTITNATIKWNKLNSKNLFTNFTVDFKRGFLTAVTGPVGCGKSNLLQVILQELPLEVGDLKVSGDLSYASQEPWIFSGTVRQNILFGSRMDAIRYSEVIKCCALERDLSLFPYGDKSVVGEKGTSLSGGQKARINLARAIYRHADIYLLDDPLSAVDTQVGKQIFEDCVCTFLKNKTIILVTHQLQYLKYVDNIIVIKDGTIEIQGSPTEVQKSGFDCAKYLTANEEDGRGIAGNTKVIDRSGKIESAAPATQEATSNSKSVFFTFMKYIQASKSTSLILLTILCFLLSQILTSLSFYFVVYWVRAERESTVEDYQNKRQTNVYIYSFITLAALVMGIFRIATYTSLSMRSSMSLHDSMLNSILLAPIRFFHLNQSGRILNRFAKDLSVIDDILPSFALLTFRIGFAVLGGLIVICVVSPWFIIPSTCMLICFWYIRRIYLRTNLNVLRVESITRSSIYGHANTSIQGLTTIRVFEVQKLLSREFNRFLDERSSAFYLSLTVARALGLWADLICFMFATLIIIYFIFYKESSGEYIGLAVSQVLQLFGQLSLGVRSLTEVEGFMVPTERVFEYTVIEPEQSVNNALQLPVLSKMWPERGQIEFKKVNLKYSEAGPYILKNISFIIKSQEKIGIAGRTGAGKSSTISALFQLAKTEGIIEIDGVNIQTINLNDLRKNISIIPQEPVLFSGTIRQNLDPFNEYDDEIIWKALEDVRLKHVVHKMDAGLNFKISQNGSNLSVGEKQLICLARAIIRNNKILILDEATANVDLQTDDLIQQTIREKFSTCTVLTVAHRLKTIMDSDKILVLDAGEIVEYDHPYILLQNCNGTFYRMVKETEASMENVLRNIAKENYERRQTM